MLATFCSENVMLHSLSLVLGTRKFGNVDIYIVLPMNVARFSVSTILTSDVSFDYHMLSHNASITKLQQDN